MAYGVWPWRGVIAAATFLCSARLGERALKNFLLHIRKLPHFDTRFGAVLARLKPPQKSAFSISAGIWTRAFLLRAENCSGRQFLGSKRVSKWGIFLISLIRFCKSRSAFSKTRGRANFAKRYTPKCNLCVRLRWCKSSFRLLLIGCLVMRFTK